MSDKAKIINKMCNIYKLDQGVTKQSSKDMGSYIYENYYKMDESEKKIICNKIISIYDLNKILLKYEIDNLVFDEKISDTHELIITIDKLLKKYHYKAGGFLFEDNIWRLYDVVSGQKKYDLKPNEYIFDNSIKAIDVEDSECYTFVNSLVSLFSRLTDNHKFRYKYIEDNYENIYWIIIKIVHIDNDTSTDTDMKNI